MKTIGPMVLVLALAACTGTPDVKIVGDYTKGIANICPLHGRKMQKHAAVVVYGFIYSGANASARRDAYERAKAAHFPFGETAYPTSEEAEIIGIDHVWIYTCRDCIAAAHTWRYGKKANQSVTQRRGADAPQRG